MTPFESAMEKAAEEHLSEEPARHGVSHEYSFKRGTQAALTHLTQAGEKFGPRVRLKIKGTNYYSADYGADVILEEHYDQAFPGHHADKVPYVPADELAAERAAHELTLAELREAEEMVETKLRPLAKECYEEAFAFELEYPQTKWSKLLFSVAKAVNTFPAW